MNLNAAKRLSNKIRLDKPNWPVPIKYIGGGVDGRVYLTDNGKLMKITFDADPQEFRGLAKLQNTGMVPKFNKRNWAMMGKDKKGTKVTAFLMGQVGGPRDTVMTLHEYIKQGGNLINWKSAVSRAIRKMHMVGVSHGNLHENNILVTISPGGKVKLFIIDFGRSIFFPVGMTERTAYASMKTRGMHRTGEMNVPLFLNKKGIPHRADVHMGIALYTPTNRNAEARLRNARRLLNIKKTIKKPNTQIVKVMNGIFNVKPKNNLPFRVNTTAMKVVNRNNKTLITFRKLTNVLPRWKKIS
jgi:hypothetical protein